MTNTDPKLMEAWDQMQADLEWQQGEHQLAHIGPSVSIFGSARLSPEHDYYRYAREVARQLGQAGYAIVSGGGPGVMEAANRGARDASVKSVGLNILLPGSMEPANDYLDISIDFHHFFVRKLVFMRYANAYVAMPGGFGTLDELLEVITMIQTRKAPSVPVIMAGTAFWKGLMSWAEDTLLAQGMVSEANLKRIMVLDDAEEICDAIRHFDATR